MADITSWVLLVGLIVIIWMLRSKLGSLQKTMTEMGVQVRQYPLHSQLWITFSQE